MKRSAPAVLLLLLAWALTSCSDDEPPQAEPSATPSSSPTAPRTASAAPRPRDRACYDLDFDEAVAPTAAAKPVSCARRHTAMTYAVGTLDSVVDGHLVAVDSRRVQAQVARTCPRRLADFVGASVDDLRLSMLRAVWFTPTLAESDAGADWYRCDVIAVATEGELAPLTGRLAGVFDSPAGRDRYGMCGTDEPDSADFARVICSRNHAWRAVRTVGFDSARYPGEGAARAAGQEVCLEAARSRAPDALDFTWGYEWPTAKQWRSGQTYGLCWAPD